MSAFDNLDTPPSWQTGDEEILRVPQWVADTWLLHGFSLRGRATRRSEASPAGGGFNLGSSLGSLPQTVQENRRRFLGLISPAASRAEPYLDLVTLKQMHSALTRKVSAGDAADRASMWGDGLMTADAAVILGIQTADCLPVLVADRRLRTVAAFHAGWRGTLKQVVERGIQSMHDDFGSQPRDLTAAIGPGIGSCCFGVGPEVRALFMERFAYADELFTAGDRLHLDLVMANRLQLLRAGVADVQIHTLNECTSCKPDRFFSYRAENGNTGRMMAAIGIALAP